MADMQFSPDNNHIQQAWSKAKVRYTKITAIVGVIQKTLTDRKMIATVFKILAGAAIILLIRIARQVRQQSRMVRQQAATITHLSSYDTQDLFTQMPELQSRVTTIQQLINTNQDIQTQIDTYTSYASALQVPYTHFLQNLYLPSLYIRKDPYQQDIDTSIIGPKFLQRNPFDHIKLIQERSSFFKNISDGTQLTQVSNVTIGDIVQGVDMTYYKIPVAVSFRAPSKRAFLMLVNKISLTSYQGSVALINEFFYHLRDIIKTQKKQTIEQLPFAAESLDKAIGYNLYQRVMTDAETPLVDKTIIQQTIARLSQCEGELSDKCYYNFREKYRSIPELAYGLTVQDDPTQQLQIFLRNIPPILIITDFTFAKQVAALTQQVSYNGTITFDVYGRAMTDSDINEIQNHLANQCFVSQESFTPDFVLNQLDQFLRDLSNLRAIDQSQSNQLVEVQQTIQSIANSYDKYSSYDKAIKLFEMYRMLQEIGLCTN